MIQKIFALALLVAAGLAQAAAATLDAALAEAQKRNAPVLVDFTAPWCYSCYYMAKNVLTGPEWQKVEREVVVLLLDADSPEGAAAREKFKVKSLPSYVVLNAQGLELGRISAERTRAQFYPELAAITGRNTALEVLRQRATAGGPAALVATREVLRSYLARGDAEAGLAWFSALPASARDAALKDASAARKLARLELKKAVDAKSPEACYAASEAALTGALDCDSVYDLDSLLGCTKAAPAERRRDFLLKQQSAFDKLLSRRVLNAAPSCADARTSVFAVAGLHEAVGDAPGQQAVMARAIAQIEARVLKNPKADRNAADNLRVYYDETGNYAKLDALLARLMTAWPDDYVYANRYARSLAARGEHEKALPHFQQAAALAYGINRLKNAEARAKSLLALKRGDEARSVVAETLKANGPWFPEDAARLKQVLQ